MSLAAQDKCAFVLERISNGDRVRFLQDYYGVQYAELVPKWTFWRKIRVQLDSQEFTELKARLRTRRAGAAV